MKNTQKESKTNGGIVSNVTFNVPVKLRCYNAIMTFFKPKGYILHIFSLILYIHIWPYTGAGHFKKKSGPSLMKDIQSSLTDKSVLGPNSTIP